MAVHGWTGTLPGPGEDIRNSELYVRLGLMPEDGTLDSIEIASGFTSGASPIRVALYKNGSAAGNVTGATLVEDLGTVTAPTTGNWATIASTTNPALNTTDQYWLAFKTDVTGQLFVPYQGTNPSNGIYGSKYLGSDESADEADAWDATVANPTSQANRWHAVRINYTPSGVDVSLGTVDGGASVQPLTKESRALTPPISAGASPQTLTPALEGGVDVALPVISASADVGMGSLGILHILATVECVASVQALTVEKRYTLTAIAAGAGAFDVTSDVTASLGVVAAGSNVTALTKETRALLAMIATAATMQTPTPEKRRLLEVITTASASQVLSPEIRALLVAIDAGASVQTIAGSTAVDVSLGIVSADASVVALAKEARALLSLLATAATVQGLTPEAQRLLQTIAATAAVRDLTPEVRALLDAIDAGASVQTIAGSVALVLYPIAFKTGPALIEPMIGAALKE